MARGLHLLTADMSIGPESIYANYFRVGNSKFEFVIEFGESRNGETEPPCRARVVMLPVFAKQLALLLTGRVQQFESTHQPISVLEEME